MNLEEFINKSNCSSWEDVIDTVWKNSKINNKEINLGITENTKDKNNINDMCTSGTYTRENTNEVANDFIQSKLNITTIDNLIDFLLSVKRNKIEVNGKLNACLIENKSILDDKKTKPVLRTESIWIKNIYNSPDIFKGIFMYNKKISIAINRIVTLKTEFNDEDTNDDILSLSISKDQTITFASIRELILFLRNYTDLDINKAPKELFL